MKRFYLLLALVVVATIGLCADAAYQLTRPLAITDARVVEVPSGASLRVLLLRWKEQGLFNSPRQATYLSWYARLTRQDVELKSGEYELVAGVRATDLTALLVSGRGLLHELRIIEGWTLADMLQAVRADPRLLHSQPGLTAESLMESLGRAGEPAEGRFFPDTYRFPRGTADLAIMRQAYETMRRVLDEAWHGRDPGLPLAGKAEALTLASIIEKETGLASERRDIAGVFTRRLRLGMRLQTDPTVIYGMGDSFDGNLRRRDLERDTPHNTYTRHGLPPTPICLPGRDSIHAAVHPAPGDTLYFVARGDGSHQFSATVEEHNAAVRKYQLKRRKS